VLTLVNAEGFERFEVEFLRARRAWSRRGFGLEDDLVLVMHLEAVGVFAVAPVVGADGRLDVRHVPGFGSEHAQEGGGVHRPCADLGVVGLCDQASVRCPEVLKFEDDGLEGGRHGYFRFTISDFGLIGNSFKRGDYTVPESYFLL